MIKLENVSKRLGKFELKDISIEIPEGYICGLVGPNGAGKTTLLHLILGLYRQSQGDISIMDRSYERDEKLIHDEIGTVLVEDLFEGSLTAMENASRYGRYFSRYDESVMKDYLALFHIDENRKFDKLSKGEKLKCQFAFALAHNPKLLILDEPTGNFDPEFREQFWNILKEYMKDGSRSVILATHLTEDLDRISDYLIYLEKGKQVFAGDMETLRESYRIVYGERYKINLIQKENIIYIEETNVSTKALVKHSRWNRYDESLKLTYPSIEEFMYCYTKREGRK